MVKKPVKKKNAARPLSLISKIALPGWETTRVREA